MSRRSYRAALLLALPLMFASNASADLMQRSWEATLDAWNRTRDLASSAWESTRSALGGDQSEDGFAQVWDGILPKLQDALVLEDRQAALPEKAWFGEDQVSNRAAINDLLDESIAILSISPTQRYRERIRELQAAIQKAQEDIADYRQRRVAAPHDSLWSKTVAQYDAAIAARSDDIVRYNEELQKLKGELAGELSHLGLKLSEDQLEFLLSTVTGDQLIEMGIAFDNVKAITQELEQLMVASREDLNAARRYYGMYLVLLKVLARMHQHLIEAVDARYLPRIEAISQKTRRLLEDTRALQGRSAANAAVLGANIEAQELTLRTADVYRQYLVEQSRDVAAAQARLAQDIAIAANTYETVKVSGELVSLMRTSQRLLDALLSRQVPALRPFQNLEMKHEFEKLTARLRQGGAT